MPEIATILSEDVRSVTFKELVGYHRSRAFAL